MYYINRCVDLRIKQYFIKVLIFIENFDFEPNWK